MLTSITQIETELTAMQNKYNQAAGQLALLKQQRAEKETALNAARHDIEMWELEQILLTKVSEFARQDTINSFEEIITSVLKAIIHDQDLRFKVSLGEYRGEAAAWWFSEVEGGGKVISDETEVEKGNSEQSFGGGVVAIESLARRLVMLELTNTGGPLWLDEAFKGVSAGYASGAGYFLSEYTARTQRQTVAITHLEKLAEHGNKWYRVKLKAPELSEVTLS